MSKFGKGIKRFIYMFIAICFWILIWHFYAKKVNSKIFLPEPKEAFDELFRLCKTKEFFITVEKSFVRIIKGFLMAVIIGMFLSVVSAFIKMVRMLVEPLMKLIKSIPVASFIILALLWIESSELATFISCIMVLPVIYINVLDAFDKVDKKLIEMADVFRVKFIKKLVYIYLPQIMTGFVSGCKIGLGFCFKAGIAAEIIGLPVNSIGWELYQAKLYLETEKLFAWTIVIVAISWIFEIICVWLLNKLLKCFLEVNYGGLLRKKYVDSKKKNSYLQRKNKYVNQKNHISADIINIQNISKNYGSKAILNNVNITLERGKICYISGQSGIGKTTFLHILLGIIKADSGQISLGKDKQKEMSINKFCGRMGVVFQEDRLIEEADIYTNMKIVAENISEEEIGSHLNELCVGAKVNKKVNQLSGGMKRRVAIMRCILSDGDILVFDEPFNGLDTDTRKKARQYIEKYCKNKFVVLITHDEISVNNEENLFILE